MAESHLQTKKKVVQEARVIVQNIGRQFFTAMTQDSSPCGQPKSAKSVRLADYLQERSLSGRRSFKDLRINLHDANAQEIDKKKQHIGRLLGQAVKIVEDIKSVVSAQGEIEELTSSQRRIEEMVEAVRSCRNSIKKGRPEGMPEYGMNILNEKCLNPQKPAIYQSQKAMSTLQSLLDKMKGPAQIKTQDRIPVVGQQIVDDCQMVESQILTTAKTSGHNVEDLPFGDLKKSRDFTRTAALTQRQKIHQQVPSRPLRQVDRIPQSATKKKK